MWKGKLNKPFPPQGAWSWGFTEATEALTVTAPNQLVFPAGFPHLILAQVLTKHISSG